jgi:hypothetical protein
MTMLDTWKVLTAHADGGVNHDDVVLVVVVEIFHQLTHLLKRESLRIKGEHPTSVHVVYVGPHGLQWDLRLRVVVDNLSDLKDIAITISALVELEEIRQGRADEDRERTPNVQ